MNNETSVIVVPSTVDVGQLDTAKPLVEVIEDFSPGRASFFEFSQTHCIRAPGLQGASNVNQTVTTRSQAFETAGIPERAHCEVKISPAELKERRSTWRNWCSDKFRDIGPI